ncbi:hypothetical protein BRC81_17425 [Halobacteriales archaeon QS_1_68_20]|nr:MAG: hypothetical protein BRC81_17425 [Halobacteriales archaeon QS_1_68_20]
MTGSRHSAGGGPASGIRPAEADGASTSTTPADLADLVDDEEVALREGTVTHEERDYCESEAAGRAIVGVTDEQGRVLVLFNETADRPALPNEVVDPGDDWASVGRRAVDAPDEGWTGRANPCVYVPT